MEREDPCMLRSEDVVSPLAPLPPYKMNQQKIEKLEAELMLIGFQLLYDSGHLRHAASDKRVAQWARTNASAIARRLDLK
jgi:hypothetical protein